MSNSINFETVDDYNQFNQHETLHPLVSVIDFSKAHKRTGSKMYFNLYCIFLKDVKCGDLKYGRATYDYQEGTLVFVSPGQIVDVENKIDIYQPLGHGLVFHPDLIKGTSLAKSISEYGFFGYQTNEALHLSKKEQQMVLEMFADIQSELSRPVDKHSKKVITSNIELFLNHCDRFYDRQFITRENINKGTLEKFEELLNNYFSSEKPNTVGLPSVAYCADELHFSPNYFGDLIKKETGKTAQEYIQNKIIDVAKERVFNIDKSIAQIAYELGFKYPQHFIRLFKQRTGVTPNEYRSLN
ncbi:Methylphosphotriester-DNA--protein-cysteine S-methyltransferase [Chryseobacterium nakagawai]|uniref:AraC family transcriptional regulator n=1 Tax=Chryseobacterium nakagawai TaxID=1241982 RepID=A0AAD0YTL1_CHRNA|nr:helix-turn-helix domain-containing protein [Chryseobacterium nakagawai]AZA92791.1 AraC family transcriptional regulator [Chryseobacterium nakagawai]VEH19399.1 Methylphosphotriester-DNA--protein-cysteine S-methyltransferase [Chryseobacterium nakagawai]